MKNVLFLIFASSLMSINVFSQKIVPENVKKEFSKKYPTTEAVKWDSEDTNEWEAEFKVNGTEMSASFDNKGIWLETEAEINAKDLPVEVTNTIAKNFAGFKTGEVSTIETPKMKGYEVQLKKDDTSLEVVFDNSGKVIKSKEAGNENEK